MTQKDGANGKVPRKPRTASHEPAEKSPERPPRGPAAHGAEIPPPGAEDRPTGRTEPQSPPSSPDPNGRDEMGRFGPGNTLSRGHSGHRKVSEMRRAAMAAETPDRVATVIARLYDLATGGGDSAVPAAKVYLEHVIGKAVQGVEISGPDGSPLERSAELSVALGAALAPFSDEIKFAVLGVMKRTIDAGRTE